MIPYTTCMRFNTRKRSVNDADHSIGQYNPSEWTLVQHFDAASGMEPSLINISSQDDQTLCFTWTIDSQFPFDRKRDSFSSFTSERQESEEFDEKSVYLLLTLRRRKSFQQSIHSETISLLDLCYYGITDRYLRQSYQWNFNTFSLDIMTGGHSLSSLLIYLFKEYKLIDIFNLDLINVMRCFHYLENGYHDTNPYHNSIHAADVTQAMHCFLQEPKILSHLSPMEIMCALLAAVAHDLDHPGVNQNFLVATKSHLAALYNNFSVLESHHWRFALSCFYESHIFDHFDRTQWQEIEFLLKHLILATDISRQGEFIQQFKDYNVSKNGIDLSNAEQRAFSLQIALKCADLGNPCRPWNISKKWSEQICNEFYRQGDFERQLNLPITSICDRKATTIPKIQTDFFKNIVRPLFEIWHKFLDSPLSRQLMNNLNFNEYMWTSMNVDAREAVSNRKTRRNSISSILIGSDSSTLVRRSKSNIDISSLSLQSWNLDIGLKTHLKELEEKVAKPKCINGCGTPPDNTSSSDKTDETDIDEEADIITDRFNDDYGAILSTPALFLPHYYREKNFQASSRRGSAPDCISFHKNEMSTVAFKLKMRGVMKPHRDGSMKRRSSFPALKISSLRNSNISLPLAIAAHHCSRFAASCNRGRSFDLNSYKNSVKTKTCVHFGSKYRKTNDSFYHSKDQASLLLDVPIQSTLAYQNFLNDLGKDRRRSVPQDIFIRSLNNYTP